MSEMRDLSRLPESDAYWQELEAKVLAAVAADDALPMPASWWAPLAERAGVLGTLAAAAAIAALLLLPRTGDAVMLGALMRPPADLPVVAAFVAAPMPPPLHALMLPPTEAVR